VRQIRPRTIVKFAFVHFNTESSTLRKSGSGTIHQPNTSSAYEYSGDCRFLGSPNDYLLKYDLQPTFNGGHHEIPLSYL
jgi:hypothetical protein